MTRWRWADAGRGVRRGSSQEMAPQQLGFTRNSKDTNGLLCLY